MEDNGEYIYEEEQAGMEPLVRCEMAYVKAGTPYNRGFQIHVPLMLLPEEESSTYS